jgi:hypothetical protein
MDVDEGNYGRPLQAKTALDDSGIVTSRQEGINQVRRFKFF